MDILVDDENDDEIDDENQELVLFFLLVCAASLCFPFVALLYPGVGHDGLVFLSLIIISSCIPGVELTLLELRYFICNLITFVMFHFNIVNNHSVILISFQLFTACYTLTLLL